jgi:hypothetical protein
MHTEAPIPFAAVALSQRIARCGCDWTRAMATTHRGLGGISCGPDRGLARECRADRIGPYWGRAKQDIAEDSEIWGRATQ